MIETVAGFLSAHQAGLSLAIVIAVFIAFMLERFPPAVIAAGGAALFLAFGFISTEDALGAFSNSAPITIAAMFVLSGALVRTGAIEAVATRILGLAETKPRLALAGLLLGAFVASAFVNNTPVVLILIPIMARLAGALDIPASRLLIPLSFAAILGGSCTLIGTSTNLLVDGVARDLGQPAFGIFDITAVGLVASVAGGLFLLLFSGVLLPKGRSESDAGEEPAEPMFLTDLRVREGAAVIGQTLGEAKALAPRGVKVIGLRRGGKDVTARREDFALEARDRLIVRATLSEMLTLAAGKDFQVGVNRRAVHAEAKTDITEVSIAGNHVSVGRTVADIPFLSRFPVRILGVSRYRHHAGPDLSSTRLKGGDRLLLEGDSESFQAMRANSSLIFAGPPTARAFRRERVAVAVAALAGVVVLAALGLMPIAGVALIGVAAILVLRCIDAEEAWSFLEGNVLVLIFAMLMIGVGLQNTGAVDLLVAAAGPGLKSASPFFLLLGIYAFTSFLTESVTNNAVAVLMTPIVIALADGLGVEPRPLIVAVMFAASASFATPVGYQTNTLVYAAGNYHFTDFMKIGVPMNIVVGLASCGAIYFLFGGADL